MKFAHTGQKAFEPPQLIAYSQGMSFIEEHNASALTNNAAQPPGRPMTIHAGESKNVLALKK